MTETGIERLEFYTDYLAMQGLDPKVAPGNNYLFRACKFYPLPGRKFFAESLEDTKISFYKITLLYLGLTRNL